MSANFADWVAICETKARYCRVMDTKDWAGWANCFTEDLVLDTSPAGGARVASPLAQAVTNQSFAVDGGWSVT